MCMGRSQFSTGYSRDLHAHWPDARCVYIMRTLVRPGFSYVESSEQELLRRSLILKISHLDQCSSPKGKPQIAPTWKKVAQSHNGYQTS